MNTALIIIFGLFSLTGFLGIVIPGIPDTILIFIGGLIFAIFTKFQVVSLTTILILAGLTALTYLIDWLSVIYGAKKYGATKYGIFGAVIGGAIGFIAFSFVGLIIFAMIGTALAEIYIAKKEYGVALKSSFGVLIGLLLSMIIKITIAVAMVVLALKDIF